MNKNNKKKWFLGVGAISIVATPIFVTISCGSSKPDTEGEFLYKKMMEGTSLSQLQIENLEKIDIIAELVKKYGPVKEAVTQGNKLGIKFVKDLSKNYSSTNNEHVTLIGREETIVNYNMNDEKIDFIATLTSDGKFLFEVQYEQGKPEGELILRYNTTKDTEENLTKTGEILKTSLMTGLTGKIKPILTDASLNPEVKEYSWPNKASEKKYFKVDNKFFTTEEKAMKERGYEKITEKGYVKNNIYQNDISLIAGVNINPVKPTGGDIFVDGEEYIWNTRVDGGNLTTPAWFKESQFIDTANATPDEAIPNNVYETSGKFFAKKEEAITESGYRVGNKDLIAEETKSIIVNGKSYNHRDAVQQVHAVAFGWYPVGTILDGSVNPGAPVTDEVLNVILTNPVSKNALNQAGLRWNPRTIPAKKKGAKIVPGFYFKNANMSGTQRPAPRRFTLRNVIEIFQNKNIAIPGYVLNRNWIGPVAPVEEGWVDADGATLDASTLNTYLTTDDINFVEMSSIVSDFTIPKDNSLEGITIIDGGNETLWIYRSQFAGVPLDKPGYFKKGDRPASASDAPFEIPQGIKQYKANKYYTTQEKLIKAIEQDGWVEKNTGYKNSSNDYIETAESLIGKMDKSLPKPEEGSKVYIDDVELEAVVKEY